MIMRLGGRVQAAIEVLKDMAKRKRPVAETLRDWGNAHRFAGSGDRAAIGNIVYDALRNRASTAYRMDSDKPRRLVMGTLLCHWEYDAAKLAAAFEGDKFAPDGLSEKELLSFTSQGINDAPLHVQGDIPEWCQSSFEANFDEEWLNEAKAMTHRPPVDLRVNTLKSQRDKVARALQKTGAVATEIALNGLRIPAGDGFYRQPNVQAEAGFQKGQFEIQDEGSQIVSELALAKPGEQVLDFCAGAGGKTLALAAAMENQGQLHAYDSDKHRLKPIYERIRRAGTRNVQVHAPDDDLASLVGTMDKVVIDAPCTGSGTWRRRPDAKWRLSPENLERRLQEQEEVLSQGAPFVRPGGCLIYITCSVLPEENENQVYAFCDDNAEFELLSAGEAWQELYGFDKKQPWSSDMKCITLTPASTDTDGFFFAVLGRKT
jgi:16S rRNA (cytosine967-C5)-methyltransferase